MSNKRNADEFERKRWTSVRIQGKSGKNGFDFHQTVV